MPQERYEVYREYFDVFHCSLTYLMNLSESLKHTAFMLLYVAWASIFPPDDPSKPPLSAGHSHEEAARLIAGCWVSRSRPEVEFMVAERKQTAADVRRSSISLLSQMWRTTPLCPLVGSCICASLAALHFSLLPLIWCVLWLWASTGASALRAGGGTNGGCDKTCFSASLRADCLRVGLLVTQVIGT